MKGKIVGVSRVNGQPMHCFRPGEIVTILSIDKVPVSDADWTEYWCEGSDGIHQTVFDTDLEVL